MTEKNTIKLYEHKKSKYKLVPPDGGWGYVIALSIVVTTSIRIMPIVAFGIIHGQFLENLTDEASATGLINGSTVAVQWFSGIIANPLLQKISYRKASVIGVIIYLIGVFCVIFITTVNQLLVCSILQGLGTGLIMCSSLTAFNYYFDKKCNLVLSISFTIMVIISVAYPTFFSYSMKTYGFRGTLIILAGLSLHCLPAVLCLHPIEWYRKKKFLDVIEDKTDLNINTSVNTELKVQELINKSNSNSDDSKKCCTTCLRFWIRFAKYLDLGLFLDPVYVNTSIGVSLCLASDYAFIGILPLLLKNGTTDANNATILLTIFYASDIVGRALLITLNAFTCIPARKLTLIGSILAVIYRLAFVEDNSFWWLAVCLALIGSIRSFFEVNYTLIFVEMYKERFTTAFSLYFVVCGIISLLLGVLIGVVKVSTQSNQMVVYLLSAMYAICAITWIIEIFIIKFTRKSA